MPTVIWIIIGAAVLAVCAGSRKGKRVRPAGTGRGPYRTDYPHLIDADDYECSVCRRRFPMNVMFCPYCGARFSERVEDDREFLDEEDEAEARDEEDGL